MYPVGHLNHSVGALPPTTLAPILGTANAATAGATARNLCEVLNFGSGDVSWDQGLPKLTNGEGRKVHRLAADFKKASNILNKFNAAVLRPDGQMAEMGRGSAIMDNLFKQGSVSLVKDYGSCDDRDKLIRFKMAEEFGNVSTQLIHHPKLHNPFKVISTYQFKMMNEAVSGDGVLFWQAQETGGGMDGNIGEGGRIDNFDIPSVALELRGDNSVIVKWNTLEPVADDIPRIVQREHPIGNAAPGQWQDFRVRLDWDRSKPSIGVEMNGKTVFLANERFGSWRSDRHFSKIGTTTAVPFGSPDKGKASIVSFDNYREVHRETSRQNAR